MRAARAVAAIVAALCATSLVSACASDARPPDDTAVRARGAGGLPGEVVSADTLANTRIGGPYGTVLAFRFRAGWTGVVRAVRFYIVLNSEGRDGYSGGTGGTLRVAMTGDSGAPRHVPAGRALGAATLAAPRRDAWPLVRLDKAVRVVAGHYYHVVFTNRDPDPRTNYVSVNALLSYGNHGPAPRTPDGMSVLLGSSSNGGRTAGRWQPRTETAGEDYVPILDVVGSSSSQHLGVGYMEVWSNNPKPIGGDAKVRQLLGSMSGRTITGAWLRVRRQAGARAALQLSVERASGGVLRSATVPARAVGGRNPSWVHVRFSRPLTVKGGERLALTAAASQAGSFEAFPIRKGTEFGFSPRTVFDGGYAQFTDAGTWVGWDQWGDHDRHNGDLQFQLDFG